MWFRHDNKANNGVSILFTRFSHRIGTDDIFFHNSLELGTHNISQFKKMLYVCKTTFMNHTL